MMHSTLPAAAPVDMVMPQAAQLWMNYLNWGMVGIMLLLALNYWRRQGTPVGVFFLIGGALTTLNEPIVDVLGKCWFPAIGAWVILSAWGVSIPAHMLPVYTWYVGGQALIAYRIYGRGISMRGVFLLYAAFAVVNVALEMPGLNLAQPMYSYFGNQPLVIEKFPLWWTFVNALMPMMMAGIVFRLHAVLRGWRQLLAIPLAWMSASATNGAISAPVWLALNLQYSSMGITLCAAIISLGLGLMVCYGLALMVGRDAPPLPSRHDRLAAP
jgi:hypothetical protein